MNLDPREEARRAAEQAMQHHTTEDFEAIRQGQYEEEVVKFLLRKFGLQNWAPDLRDMARVEIGHGRLRLAFFNQLFDSFPVVLGSWYPKRIGADVNVRLLFSNFSQMPFVRQLEEHFENVKAIAKAKGKAVGLICKWPYLQGGLVLHNLNVELDKTGTRMVWVQQHKTGHAKERKDKVRRLVLEDLTSFCSALSGWKPET